jgi:hypothetical protein
MDTVSTPLATALQALKTYELGSNRGDLLPIEQAVRFSLGDQARREVLEKNLLLALDDASVLGQVYLLKQLVFIGSARAIPKIAERLRHPDLADAACRTLAVLPAREAGEVLRRYLPSLTGMARFGAIHVLGRIRDTASVPMLTEWLTDNEPTLQSAAAAALGRIGTSGAARALADRFEKAPATQRPGLAHAIRECADQLTRAGEPSAAKNLLQRLD